LHFDFAAILHDMSRLAEMRNPGVMLILTCWQTKDARKDRGLYSRELGVSAGEMEMATFPISTKSPGDWEFAVIGFLVPPVGLSPI
jgi:hypothetical protein